MKVLVVGAHPRAASYNRAIVARLTVDLQASGHEVEQYDLYDEGFAALLTEDDMAANYRGQPAADVRVWQQRLRWADALLLVYPVWWFGPPALLKGWFDRVLTRGFAFDYGPGGMIGRLTVRRALVVMTLGGDAQTYTERGWFELMRRTLVEGVLGSCGVREVRVEPLYAVITAGEAGRTAMLDATAGQALAWLCGDEDGGGSGS